MNPPLRPAPFPAATQAAEGLPRRRWSVAEIEAMVAKGIILEDEGFEMTGGGVVPMSPKGKPAAAGQEGPTAILDPADCRQSHRSHHRNDAPRWTGRVLRARFPVLAQK